MRIVSYDGLHDSDLILDAVYEGGMAGNVSDDPISRVVPGVGNMGGFRYAGRGEDKRLVVLYTTGKDKDWPDSFDLESGRFIYFGDNRTPGHELHDTRKGGNEFLRSTFEKLHAEDESWKAIPPILVFEKFPTERSARSVRFRGLLVPGAPGVSSTRDLVAVWRSKNGSRFQNYMATFSILDCGRVDRRWIRGLMDGDDIEELAPEAWKEWRERKRYRLLLAEPTVRTRSIEEQTPMDERDKEILETIYRHFEDDPRSFEFFAADIYAMSDERVIVDEVTRATLDGGRDAVGRYKLGIDDDPIYVEFALEAKCYRPYTSKRSGNSVGVKEVSRLISRLLHRQFGVLVTTSAIARQAYEEVRKDGHPIVFLTGKDIVDILLRNDLSTPVEVSRWLERTYGGR